MKFFRRLLTISILTVVGLSIGYFVYGYTRLNNTVPQETFRKQFFKTRDEENFISFGTFNNTVLCVDTRYYFIEDVKYEENIFTFTVEEYTFNFIVINELTIYSDYFNLYFYSLKMFEV